MPTYELSFDTELIYKAIFLVPATSFAIYFINFLYNHFTSYRAIEPTRSDDNPASIKKHNIKALADDQIKSHRLVRGLDYTKRTVIYELFDKLPNRYSDYCHVSFLTDHHSFYLINDPDLIRLIRSDEEYSDVFVSQLIQPYLVLDSKCNLKIKKKEYDKVVKPIITEYFQNSLDLFTKEKMPELLELFLANNARLSQKNIFELVFKISTAYIKTVFNIKADQEELTAGEKLILYNLFEIHQTFSVGLFTNNSSEIVDDYSKCYTEFMRLIEEEFEIEEEVSIECSELGHDSSQMKFLIVKSIYLDSLKIYSCLTWFLHETNVDSSVDAKLLQNNAADCASTDELETCNALYFKETLLRSFLKTLSLDLYYVNPTIKCDIPEELSFLSRRDLLVALNIFNVVKNIEIDGAYLSENFNLIDKYIQVISDFLGFFFIRNFPASRLDVKPCSPGNESYDLPLIRYYDAVKS